MDTGIEFTVENYELALTPQIRKGLTQDRRAGRVRSACGCR